MTTLDLTKSRFLIPELRKIIAGLTQLNSVDTSLKRIIEKLYSYLDDPHQVNADEFKSVLEVARHIAHSYDQEGVIFARGLTHILEEIDFLALSKSLLKSERYSPLLQKIDRFYSLATEK
jgi:hypothetical protein